jgi:hypothetical protein
MERKPMPIVEDPPNLFRKAPFDLHRLLSHIDPGSKEEAEDFVRFIYEQRHSDVASERHKVGS